MNLFDSILPSGAWMYESGVWMFVPTTASYDDVWAASQFLDNVANTKYEARSQLPLDTEVDDRMGIAPARHD